MKNKKRILIGCNIFAAVCFGLVGYSDFYEGKLGQGLIFFMLAISQLMLGIGNINRDEEIEKMNGEDEHALELTEGDVLVVHSSVDKGSVNLEITGPDGKVVYVGNEKSNVDEFNVNIHESGKYTINVDAHHAKGRISVILG